jgi:hypothetical protein
MKSVNEEWTLYTTTQYGKKLQKLKSYKSRKAATIALGKLSAKLDTPRFPKNVDGLMIIDEAFKNESVNEAKKYSDDWNLTKRVTSNFIKQNLKSVDNSIKKKDGEGLRFHLNQIIKGIQNAKRALKLESVNEEIAKGKGVQKIFDIQKSGYGKLGGRMVDQLSAGLFTQLYDKAPDNIKEKMNKMNEKRLYIVIGKMWNKFGKNVRLSS